MKARYNILVFLAACAVSVVIIGLIHTASYISKPRPVPIAHLSRHELITPSNSTLNPENLREKLSEESLRSWMKVHAVEKNDTDSVIHEIYRYLTVNITVDMPDDPFFRYTHYYHLEIENKSDELFENISVRFPSAEAVEVRGRGYVLTELPQNNGKYILGDLEPNEKIDVYAWYNRPFYAQQDNSVVLRHGDHSVHIYNIELVKPERSWVKDNLILVIILGGLLLFIIQKTAYVIRMCSKNVDPKYEKKINLE
jgi:hypothetical protein